MEGGRESRRRVVATCGVMGAAAVRGSDGMRQEGMERLWSDATIRGGGSYASHAHTQRRHPLDKSAAISTAPDARFAGFSTTVLPRSALDRRAGSTFSPGLSLSTRSRSWPLRRCVRLVCRVQIARAVAPPNAIYLYKGRTVGSAARVPVPGRWCAKRFSWNSCCCAHHTSSPIEAVHRSDPFAFAITWLEHEPAF